MVTRSRHNGLFVNLVAYRNTVDGMRTYLKDIYCEQPRADRRIRLETELAELVNDSIPYLERRKVCARLLLRTVRWDYLVDDSMAPSGTVAKRSTNPLDAQPAPA